MNVVLVTGNLTKDPDFRTTGSGHSVCTFTLAVRRRVPAGSEQTADFLQVVCWRGLAENVSKYLTKGSKVAVQGKMQTRSYDGSDGQRKFITEIIADEVEFLDLKKKVEDEDEEDPF